MEQAEKHQNGRSTKERQVDQDYIRPSRAHQWQGLAAVAAVVEWTQMNTEAQVELEVAERLTLAHVEPQEQQERPTQGAVVAEFILAEHTDQHQRPGSQEREDLA